MISHKLSLATLLTAVGLLFGTAALASQDGSRPAQPAESATTQQAADTKQVEALRNDLAALEARVRQFHGQRAVLSEETERMRSLRRHLDERLRQARLDNQQGEEIERLRQEADDVEMQLGQSESKVVALTEQIHAMEAQSQGLTERIGALLAMRQQAQRQEDLDASEQLRSLARGRVEEISKDVTALAKQPDAAAALREAMLRSDIEELQARYAFQSQRAAELEQLYKLGRVVSQAEVTQAKMEAETVLAQMRRRMIEGMLEQVERERRAFRDRNANVEIELAPEVQDNQIRIKPTVVQGQEAVLQTEFFRGYLDTVQQYARLSSDPDGAAVAAVVTAADLLRDQPPQASIDYFEPMLGELPRPDGGRITAVEAAIRLQLAEAYNAAGDREAALRVLRELVLRGAGAQPPARE